MPPLHVFHPETTLTVLMNCHPTPVPQDSNLRVCHLGVVYADLALCPVCSVRERNTARNNPLSELEALFDQVRQITHVHSFLGTEQRNVSHASQCIVPFMWLGLQIYICVRYPIWCNANIYTSTTQYLTRLQYRTCQMYFCLPWLARCIPCQTPPGCTSIWYLVNVDYS